MRRSSWVRSVAVVACCGSVDVAAWRLVAELLAPASAALGAATTPTPRAIADLITGAAAILLALAWTWLSCAAVLMAVDVVRCGAAARRLAVPLGWHRLLAGLLGAGALCLPGAAGADVPDEDAAAGHSRPPATAVDGLPLPDRPRGVGCRPPSTPAGHEVVAGDSLWGIARDHLGPAAKDARVATTWPRWYAANIEVIGPDPDLLMPGTVLRPPAAAAPPPDGVRGTPLHGQAGTDPAPDDGGPR